MFAILAFITFLLGLFQPTLGPFDLLFLGLAFVALHLAIGGAINFGALFNRNQNRT